MKNFIKNNFYTLEELFDKIDEGEYGCSFIRYILFTCLVLFYLILLFIGSIHFVLWNFNGYEYFLRALFIGIIFNILILKK